MKIFVWNTYFLMKAAQDEREKEATHFYTCAVTSKRNCERITAVWKQFEWDRRETKRTRDTRQSDSRGHQWPALEENDLFFSLVNCPINPCLLLPAKCNKAEAICQF